MKKKTTTTNINNNNNNNNNDNNSLWISMETNSLVVNYKERITKTAHKQKYDHEKNERKL